MFLTGLLGRMKESGVDTSDSDVVEKELVKACKTAVKKDEKFVSFNHYVLYYTYTQQWPCRGDAKIVLPLRIPMFSNSTFIPPSSMRPTSPHLNLTLYT